MENFEKFRMNQKAKIEARLQTFKLKQQFLRPKTKNSIDLTKFRPLGLIAEYKNNFELVIPKYIESKENLDSFFNQKKRQYFKVVNGKIYIKNPEY